MLSLEFNRLLDYYRDAPVIDFIDEKPRREKPERPKNDQDKDRRTAQRGMARIYVNAGKADGFFAATSSICSTIRWRASVSTWDA